jgi:hypothetical protein
MILWPVDDDRYMLASDDSRTVVFDRDLRQVAELRHEQAGINTDSSTHVASGLVVLTPPPQGWTVADFAVPSLDRLAIHPLPAPTTAGRPQVVVTKDRIVTLSRHVVTTWDRATGAQLYEPTQLPEADFRGFTNVAIRPGHPDEIILTKGIGAEIWDLRQRRRIADIPTFGTLQPVGLAFFPSGDRVVALTLGSQLEVRDLADLQPMRPAFPAPGTAVLHGVTEDNYIVTFESDYRVVFWDAERGSESGAFALPTMFRPNDLTEDGREMRISAGTGVVPFTMPITAPQWAERLCAIADRPFTDQDRSLLPAGVEADGPCAAG